METQDKRWLSVMQEVDRLYWINQTSEGRIACISDYIIRLLLEKDAELETLRARAAEFEDLLAERFRYDHRTEELT